MPRLHQINEDDLRDLEESFATIASEIAEHLKPRHRVKLLRVKRILSDVRWDYGPHTNVERIEPE